MHHKQTGTTVLAAQRARTMAANLRLRVGMA
jgi:hypothetical protein